MKFRILALGLAAVLGFGAVAATGAAPKKVKSKVTIKFDPGTSSDPSDPYANSRFHGKVSSKKKKKKCRKGRMVKVIEVDQGPIGHDKTNNKGKYSVRGGGALGPDEYDEFHSFYAKVKKKKKGNVLCKGAKSAIIVAP
jgi:hypothetical protein